MVAYRRPTRHSDWLPYGFDRLRPWRRQTAVASSRDDIFILIVAYASALWAVNILRHTIMWRAIVNGFVFACVAAWYFYFKPNVVAYFRELARQ